MALRLHFPASPLNGQITLAGSKSISNRVLIIRALCSESFAVNRLANAKDTELLQSLLKQAEGELYAGAAGTTFRFMTAFLSQQPGTQVLTGTERMKQRPIKVLVEALRPLGAQIEYLEQAGYPPLSIGPPQPGRQPGALSISAGVSSQYISALLMIAPTLPQGLRLTLEGKVVSRPYILMTLRLMEYFGLSHRWEGDTITVAPQAYQPRPFTVEADWSAASYYYSMLAIAGGGQLQLNGLFADSLQGDAVLAEMMTAFGVESTFNEGGVRIERAATASLPKTFEWNFLECPDLAQTLAVCCAALGVEGHFSGLETLRIKETDRIAALQQELRKVGVKVEETGPGSIRIQGKAEIGPAPRFATYEDHRMAMAFAPLAQFGSIIIEEEEVVKKSYPDFWKDLGTLGFASEQA